MIKKTIFSISWFFLPSLIFMLAGLFVIPNQEDIIRDSLNVIISNGVFLAIVVLAPFKSLKKVVALSLLLLLCLVWWFKLSFYEIYQAKLSASALFVIFETNAQESLEFLKVYLNSFIIVLALVYLAYYVFTVKLIHSGRIILGLNEVSKKWKYTLKIASFFVLLVGLAAIPWRFSDYNLFYKANASYKEYKITRSLFKEELAQPQSSALKEVKSLPNAPKLGVVIVGESTTRTHMGLYGYWRKTNPFLTSLKDELLVGKDVITPHVHTILALENILTFTSLNNRKPQQNASVVQLANEAGYETYWISNQRPVGINETTATLIGSAAAHKKYISTNDYNRKSYDGDLLPELKKVLNVTSKKPKLVFLHLIGTHIGYDKRYPAAFDKFKDRPKTKFPKAKAYQLINHYDNAVLYNDFVVNQIIEDVKAKEENSFVVYFSDHGDEVYETLDMAGHNEYYGSKPMFEIPFVVWASQKYKENSSWWSQKETIENRPYLLDDFIYSFADLARIEFKENRPAKSIFSSSFVPKKRIIKNGEVYQKE